MTALDDWAERIIGVVETDGATASIIELSTSHDGEVWETWRKPFGSPSDWVTSAQSYLRSLEAEWPTRKVQIQFVAKSDRGEVLSRLPQTVTGKNKGGSLDSQAAASAVAFDNIAVTIEKLQRLTNTQLDAARKTAESNAEMIYQQTQLLRLYREREMLDGGSESNGDEILGAIKEHMPLALNLLSDALKTRH